MKVYKFYMVYSFDGERSYNAPTAETSSGSFKESFLSLNIQSEDVMSFLCIGQYVDNIDATQFCVDNGFIFLGFSDKDEPALHKAFAAIQVGTPVAVKAFVPGNKDASGLYIKAVVMVASSETYTIQYNGADRKAKKIKVLWHKPEGHFIGKPEGWGNVRNCTLYHEMNIDLIEQIISLIK